MSDFVNRPNHYTQHPSGVECIQITEWLGFNLGNAWKYCHRADDKGRPVEDRRKALWYVRREIDRVRSASPARGLATRWALRALRPGGGREVETLVSRYLAAEPRPVFRALWAGYTEGGTEALEAALRLIDQEIQGRLTAEGAAHG